MILSVGQRWPSQLLVYFLAPRLPYELVMVSLCRCFRKIVRLGDLNIKDDIEDGASPVDMEVDSSVPHPSFRSGYKKNDIAIVKMKGRVTFTGK